MVKNQRNTITYTLKAKLDMEGLYPTIRVQEKGEFKIAESPH